MFLCSNQLVLLTSTSKGNQKRCLHLAGWWSNLLCFYNVPKMQQLRVELRLLIKVIRRISFKQLFSISIKRIQLISACTRITTMSYSIKVKMKETHHHQTKLLRGICVSILLEGFPAGGSSISHPGSTSTLKEAHAQRAKGGLHLGARAARAAETRGNHSSTRNKKRRSRERQLPWQEEKRCWSKGL